MPDAMTPEERAKIDDPWGDSFATVERQERVAASYGMTRAEIQRLANMWALRFAREPRDGSLREVMGSAMCSALAHAQFAGHFGEEAERRRAAVRRAVVEEVAARMDGWLSRYPTDVFPPTPVTDAQSAQVLRLMLPRIKADLLELAEAGRG